jgi:precorrin-6B methylase 1
MFAGPVSAVSVAMDRLGWSTRDLYLASVAYGTVGDEDDVRRHLAEGDHLGRYERVVVAATLNDALMDRGDQLRVSPE